MKELRNKLANLYTLIFVVSFGYFAYLKHVCSIPLTDVSVVTTILLSVAYGIFMLYTIQKAYEMVDDNKK